MILAITSSFDLSPTGRGQSRSHRRCVIDPKSGRVIKIDDHKMGAVIEVESERWRLRRCTSIVHTGPQPVISWIVVSRCEE